MSFMTYSHKTRKCSNQTFLQEVDQESCGCERINQILILTLWLWSCRFLPKIAQIVQKVTNFSRNKERRWRLDFDIFSPMAEVLPPKFFIFLISFIFTGKWGGERVQVSIFRVFWAQLRSVIWADIGSFKFI